jgi:hypothetical protein
MEMENFEEQLTHMTKPGVTQLKHQEMLAKAVIQAKDKSVVSWWWLSVPFYLLAALLMKSMYMPQTSWLGNLQAWIDLEPLAAALWFLIAPAFFIVLNLVSLRKLYFLSGNPRPIDFLKIGWFQVMILLLSAFLLIIYVR